MSQDQRDTELANAGEHLGQGQGAEVVAFADIDVKGTADDTASKRCEMELAHNQGSDHARLLDAELALGQRDDQHLTALNNVLEIELGARLSDAGPDRRIGDQRTDLVERR